MHIKKQLLQLVLISTLGAAPCVEATQSRVKTAFDADCSTLLIKELNNADKEIRVAIYTLTNRKITAVLKDRFEDGINVSLKYDQAQYDEIESMKKAIDDMVKLGIPCRGVKLDHKHARMHHKFVVIDGKVTLTGSFNFTYTAATANKENLVSISGATVAREFLGTFKEL